MIASNKVKHFFVRFLVYFLLIIGAIVVMIPLVWCFLTAIKTPGEVFSSNLLPKDPQWGNFAKAFQDVPMLLYFKNTLIILIPTLVGTLISSSLVAYGFARLKVPFKNFLFMLVIGSMLLPGIVLLIPQFLIFQAMGWVGSFKPLIVPALFGSAFNIFLLRQFIVGIPVEYDEAAIMDGAGRFKIYYKLIIPMTRPALTAISIFTITGVWNDYQGPLIYLNDPTKYTLSIGLAMFKGKYSIDYTMMMAATLIVIAPIIIIFFVAQKYFIEGITLGGLKG